MESNDLSLRSVIMVELGMRNRETPDAAENNVEDTCSNGKSGVYHA
jgi:hypothetical protein